MGRDAASRELVMHTNAREAPERHRPPATTSGTCERSNVGPRDTLMCTVLRNGQGGLGAKKPPRWSAERRASPARRHGESQSAWGRAGLRHWPAKGASQAPGRLSALRFPHIVREYWQTSEVIMTRENEDACAIS